MNRTKIKKNTLVGCEKSGKSFEPRAGMTDNRIHPIRMNRIGPRIRDGHRTKNRQYLYREKKFNIKKGKG